MSYKVGQKVKAIYSPVCGTIRDSNEYDSLVRFDDGDVWRVDNDKLQGVTA